MLLGLDASNVNSDAAYAAVVAADVFVIHKATEGASFIDQKYPARIGAARATGKLVGAYHFGRPHGGWAAQAAAFIAAAKPQIGDLLVHDLEVTDTAADPHAALGMPFDRATHRRLFGSTPHPSLTPVVWSVIADGACLFADTVKAAVGIDPVFYSFPAFINPLLAHATAAARARILSMPLWIADPNHPLGHPVLPGGFTSWLLHQYGERGGLDADVLNGSQSDWYAHAVGGTPTPSPTPLAGDDDMTYLARNTGGLDQWQVAANNRAYVPTIADLGALQAKLGPSVGVSQAFLDNIPIAGTAAKVAATLRNVSADGSVTPFDAFKAELQALDPEDLARLGYTPEEIA